MLKKTSQAKRALMENSFPLQFNSFFPLLVDKSSCNSEPLCKHRQSIGQLPCSVSTEKVWNDSDTIALTEANCQEGAVQSVYRVGFFTIRFAGLPYGWFHSFCQVRSERRKPLWLSLSINKDRGCLPQRYLLLMRFCKVKKGGTNLTHFNYA